MQSGVTVDAGVLGSVEQPPGLLLLLLLPLQGPLPVRFRGQVLRNIYNPEVCWYCTVGRGFMQPCSKHGISLECVLAGITV